MQSFFSRTDSTQPAVTLVSGLLLSIMAIFPGSSNAQEVSPQRNVEYYLKEYAKFVGQLHEVRLKYVGYSTRSTDSKGIVGRWENSGTSSLSASQSAFHRTDHPFFAMSGKPRDDLGVSEQLATPNEYLDLGVFPSSDVKDKLAVDAKIKGLANEWIKELGRHELGVLFGFAPFGCDDCSLLQLAQQNDTQLVEDYAVGSKKLSGFLIKNHVLESRVLFDPSNQYRLAGVWVTRLDSSAKLGDFTGVSCELLNTEYSDSKPLFLKVHITRHQAGGRVDKPIVKEIEAGTWDYYYDLTDFEFNPKQDWFALKQRIPNATRVRVEGSILPFEWRNGKVSAIPTLTRDQIESAEFRGGGEGRRMPWLIAVNVGAIVLIVLWIGFRNRRQAIQ